MKKQFGFGLALVILPWAFLLCSLCAYAITSFVVGSVLNSNADCHEWVVSDDGYMEEVSCAYDSDLVIVANLIRIFLGFTGMVGVVGILVGNPFGLYLLFSAMTEEKKHVNKK